jgi:hypothetical protein
MSVGADQRPPGVLNVPRRHVASGCPDIPLAEAANRGADPAFGGTRPGNEQPVTSSFVWEKHG